MRGAMLFMCDHEGRGGGRVCGWEGRRGGWWLRDSWGVGRGDWVEVGHGPCGPTALCTLRKTTGLQF